MDKWKNKISILPLVERFVFPVLVAIMFVVVLMQPAGAVSVSACGVGISTDGAYYTLTQNIEATATCLQVTNNNITIDGNYFNINYSNVTVGHGISVQGYKNLTIQNLYLKQGNRSVSGSVGIYFGVNGVGTNNSYITNITINSSNSTANTNYALLLQYGSSNNTITNLTTISNASQSIFLYNGANNNTLINITIRSTTSRGIWLSTSSNNNTINNLTSNSISGDAIFISLNSAGNNIFNSIGNSSSGSGILVQNSNNTYFNNTIGRSNSNHGIYIDTPNLVTIFNNSAGYSNGTTKYGIYDNGSFDVFTNTLGDSLLSHGIWIESASNDLLTNVTGISHGNGNGLTLNNSINVQVTRGIFTSQNGFGVYTHYGGNNNYTGIIAISNNSYGVASTFTTEQFINGSITSNDSLNISNNFGCDYFLHNASATFINTNFTGNRVICFDPSDGNSTFSLDYDGSGTFLNNTLIGTTIRRNILSWNKTNITFTENNSIRVVGYNNITNYSLNGLLHYTVYKSSNVSNSQFNLSDASGGFNVSELYIINVSSTIFVTAYNFTIVPSDYTNFTVNSITTWNTNQKVFTTTGSSFTATIGDNIPFKNYNVINSGLLVCMCGANPTGYITFSGSSGQYSISDTSTTLLPKNQAATDQLGSVVYLLPALLIIGLIFLMISRFGIDIGELMGFNIIVIILILVVVFIIISLTGMI